MPNNYNININELKEFISISEYFLSELGPPKKSLSGKEIRLCPFHKDGKNPNFEVVTEGEKKGCYYCRSCGAGGDFIGFHRKHHGLSFQEALDDLARQYVPRLIKEDPKKKKEGPPHRLPPGSQDPQEPPEHPEAELPQGPLDADLVQEIIQKGKAFVDDKCPPFKGTRLENIYIHPPVGPNIWIAQIRFETKNPAPGKKPKKNPIFISYQEGSKGFEMGYAHRQYFKDGGLQTPYTGINLKTFDPPYIEPGSTVYVVEGYKQVVHLRKMGIQAITSGAANTAHKFKWSDLAPNLKLIFWPDNDTPGKKYVEKVADYCLPLGHSCAIVDVEQLNLPPGGDVADWLDQNPKAEAKDIVALVIVKYENPKKEEKKSGAPEEESWGDPILFGRIGTPEIPCSLLPSWLGEYAQAVSDHSQTPPALAVMTMLSTLSACIQNQFAVSPRNDDYIEPLIFWSATILPPATRKTGVFRSMTAPISEWEYNKAKELKDPIEENETTLNIYLKSIEKLEKDAAKTKDSVERKAIIEEINNLKKEMPPEIIPPRIYTGDVTPEQLQNLVGLHKGRFSVLSDEGGIFEIMSGLYSGGKANVDVFLKGHTANVPLIVDRTNRKPHIKRPHITVGVAVQPQIIKELNDGGKKRFRGIGLLARFGFCYPKSNVGSRNIRETVPIPPLVKKAYFDNIFDFLEIKGEQDSDGEIIAKILTLSPGALPDWEEFSQAIENRQGEGGDLHPIADWTGKLPGMALRVAGLMHVAKHGENALVINKDIMGKALELCTFLIIHAQAVFDFIGGDLAVTEAKIIFKWIIENKTKHFTRTECHEKFRGKYPRVAQLTTVLEVLTERSLISDPIKLKTKKPTIVYYINPKVFEKDYDSGLA